MTERSSGQGRADDWARGYGDDQYAGEQYAGEQYSAGQYAGGPYLGASYSDETYFGPDPRTAGPGMPESGTSGQGMPGPGPGGQGMPGPGMAGPGTAGPGMSAAPTGHPLPRQATDSRSFLSALFDFSFTSFVTIKIIKVVYVLILILTALYALAFTIWAFKLSAPAGLFVLIIGDPLFILIVMAFWRLILESFIVVFRIAEDTRAMRERGDVR